MITLFKILGGSFHYSVYGGVRELWELLGPVIDGDERGKQRSHRLSKGGVSTRSVHEVSPSSLIYKYSINLLVE